MKRRKYKMGDIKETKEKILDALDEGSEMERMDKKLRHKPVKLYCLGCGGVISEKFTGGLWSYTHICNPDCYKRNERHITCVVFGSVGGGVMIPSSIICGYKSYSRCKECKDELEHIKRVLEGCLGKGWEKRKMPTKKFKR